MFQINSIIIKGRLVRDPECKYVDVKGESKSVCRFSVAVDKTFGEGADFFDCQIWGKRAEFVEKFFFKGKEILVQGSHEQRKYKDKEGNDKTIWELKANQVEFCGSKNDSTDNRPAPSPAGTYPPEFTELGDDDEIPF